MTTVFILVSCATSAEPLPVPYAWSIDQVVITPAAAGQPRTVAVEDPAAIEPLLRFISQRDGDWHKPWDTFPTHQYMITLRGKSVELLVVWIGSNWIGGRAGNADSSDNRLHAISEHEAAEVFRIVEALR